MNRLLVLAAATTFFVSPALAQVQLSLDGEPAMSLSSGIKSIIYRPSIKRLEIETFWDDLRCVVNPDGPSVVLPEVQPGDFVLALDHQPGDLMGEYVVETDGSIAQLLAAISGSPSILEVVTSESRILNCNGGECAVLQCAPGGTPIFNGDFEVPLPPQVDFSVTGTGDTQVVAGGASIALVLEVTNASVDDASNVVIDVSGSLPAGVTVDSVIPTSGTYNQLIEEWTLPALSGGATETIQLTFSAAPSAPLGGSVCATASVVSADEPIVNTGDDSAQQCAAIEREIDLTLSVFESADPVLPGSGLIYEFQLTNQGPSDASGMTLELDTELPSGVSLGTLTTNLLGSVAGTTWNVPALSASSPSIASLTVPMTVDVSTAPGTDVISATVAVTASNETRINVFDDSATESTSVSQ